MKAIGYEHVKTQICESPDKNSKIGHESIIKEVSSQIRNYIYQF